MDAGLTYEFILNEHSNRIKEVNESLQDFKKESSSKWHQLNNIRVKDQQYLDKLEMNVATLTKNADRTADLLEKITGRLNQIESESIKKSMIKESLKYIPLVIIFISIVDYSKIVHAIPEVLTLIKSVHL